MLEIENLVLKINNRPIIKGISFCAKPGEIIGFIGPNGAGKTSTMRMIAGVLEPDDGKIKIENIDMWQSRIKAQENLGFLPEGAPLYGEMKVKSYLEFLGNIRGLAHDKIREMIIDVVEKTNLQKVFHWRIETLSKGFRRRVALAGAMLHDPKILILDEPSDGLDPNQKRDLNIALTQIAHDKIIIISSHVLDEIIKICNRIILLNDGVIGFDGSPKDFAALSKEHLVENAFYELTKDAKI